MAEIDRVPLYTDIRGEDEYIFDEQKQDSVHEVFERYKFTLEFLSQDLQCSHCGALYRPKDNFAGFRCRMHPGSIRLDGDEEFSTMSCCGQTFAETQLSVGCVPCIHSFRVQDFNDIILTQQGHKYLPMEMADILKAFPIDRKMIIGEDYEKSRYVFATSEAQLLRERALSHPDRKVTSFDMDDDLDEYGDSFAASNDVDKEEEELLQAWEESIQVADDNWKIKMYIH
jgi:hypothetical protein